MDPEIQKKILKAGKIAALVREKGLVKLSKPGTSFLKTMDFCEELIRKEGAEVAWAQLSPNETAAHFCPTDEDTSISKEGDVIKIDIGVHIDGYIADTAATVEVNTKEHQDMIKAAKNALNAAIKLAKPGTPLWQLGEAQISEAESLGFTTIKNLSGHTLGKYKVHSGISIPSFNNKDQTELQEDWQIAIEPFVTDGQGLIKEKGPATVFMLHKEKGVRLPYARKIMEDVKLLNGLPFTTRWLTRKFGRGVTLLGLKELQRFNVIRSYPPLVEISNAVVTQAEHSIIVKEKPIVYTKTD